MAYETTGFDLRSANIRAIDGSKLLKSGGAEALDETFRYFVERQQMYLEADLSKGADTAGHPGYDSYAAVTVNGKVVARLDNNGFLETSNALGGQLLGQLPGDVNGKTGPELAQARAEKIAGLLGGKVERSASTLSQAEYDALSRPGAIRDDAASNTAPASEGLQKTRQARSAFATQQMAQEKQVVPGGDSTTEETGGSDAAEAFLEYMRKSPEERFFEAFLQEKGLTQEQFEQLPPEEKKKILQEFEQRMAQQNMIGVAESMAATAARKKAATASMQSAATPSLRDEENSS